MHTQTAVALCHRTSALLHAPTLLARYSQCYFNSIGPCTLSLTLSCEQSDTFQLPQRFTSNARTILGAFGAAAAAAATKTATQLWRWTVQWRTLTFCIFVSLAFFVSFAQESQPSRSRANQPSGAASQRVEKKQLFAAASSDSFCLCVVVFVFVLFVLRFAGYSSLNCYNR